MWKIKLKVRAKRKYTTFDSFIRYNFICFYICFLICECLKMRERILYTQCFQSVYQEKFCCVFLIFFFITTVQNVQPFNSMQCVYCFLCAFNGFIYICYFIPFSNLLLFFFRFFSFIYTYTEIYTVLMLSVFVNLFNIWSYQWDTMERIAKNQEWCRIGKTNSRIPNS